MIRVCHVFDRTAAWEQRVAATQLLARLPREQYEHVVATIGTVVPPFLRTLNLRPKVLPTFAPRTITAAPLLRKLLGRERVDLIHAWSINAALAARAASNKALTIELFDPRFSSSDMRAIGTLARSGKLALVCSTETIRRRLIEGGVKPETCAVIRPGVDFSLIRECRKRGVREALGLRRDDLVMIVPEPATRHGSQLESFWAVELVSFSRSNAKIIVPGISREVRRISRFANVLPNRDVFVATGAKYPFEELVPIADIMMVATRGEISTTAIAWAMASDVAVVGTAVYSVAELIANKLNGLLFKPESDEAMGVSMARLIRQDHALAKVREVARGHAYEVFGITRCMEQHARMYQNMLNGKAPGEGLVDSALGA